MRVLTVEHVTTYRYSAPVALGRHRLMLRPRDSHDMRLIDADLVLSPPGNVTWLHDVFSNSVALVDFAEPSPVLSIASTLKIERYAAASLDFPISPEATAYPFMHSADDRTDLGRLRERQYPDKRGAVEQWARQFVTEQTWEVLRAMNAAIHDTFTYNARYEEGTQAPTETLEQGTGTCRDFALLFIEAARSLGFGARFVTGYLYDPTVDNATGVRGAGATHAWAEIYLPGAGWVEFDPTNGLIAAESLIRVAVTRDPTQAAPVTGSYTGTGGEFLGLEVDVTVQSADRGAAAEGTPPS